jgi:hypothetical protein
MVTLRSQHPFRVSSRTATSGALRSATANGQPSLSVAALATVGPPAEADRSHGQSSRAFRLGQLGHSGTPHGTESDDAGRA